MKPFLHSALDLLTISCVSTVVRAEPDQDLLGKAQGYPVGNASTGVVARAPAPSALPKAANLAAILYRYKNNSYTLNDYLGRQRTTAPLVPKNGEIMAGQHRYSRTDDARFLSFSMVKRVISLLLGQALADGGFNASLRDWGWLGLLLAHDGQAGMEQVVPLHNLLTSVWESIGGEQNPQPYEERDALWPGVLQSLGGDLIPY